jgi:hypothetical protein
MLVAFFPCLNPIGQAVPAWPLAPPWAPPRAPSAAARRAMAPMPGRTRSTRCERGPFPGSPQVGVNMEFTIND